MIQEAFFSKINIEKEAVFQWIIYTLSINFVWEIYLTIRQHNVYRRVTVMPDALIGITKKGTFEKARLYALDKSAYGMFADVITFAETIIILYVDGFFSMWSWGGRLVEQFGYKAAEHEILQSCAFLLVMNTVNLITKLPLSAYYTFVLEEKHGFNNQTAWFFIKDKMKSYILGQVLSIVLASGITYVIKAGGEYFFIYLWVFAIVLMLFFMTIYPDFIAPLFDTYTPLPEGDLRTQIEKLAASIEFPLTKLYVVEGSKRSAHSNAYFYGLFNNKRIVLFDTLLKSTEGENQGKGCDDGEVLAVLCHELGHWKLNHVVKNIVIMQVNMFLLFFIFNSLIQQKPLYEAIGFHDSAPVLVGLLVVLQFVMTPYFSILGFGLALLSRRYEFQADAFAKKLGRCYALKSALIKLNADNLGFPIYDSWFSTWQHSHPPLLERLAALEKTD